MAENKDIFGAAQSVLATILESVDEAIISMTGGGRVIAWNKAAERILGYTAQEMIGQSASLIIPDSTANQEARILEQVRLGQKVEHFRTQLLQKGGQSVEVMAHYSPIRDDIGRITGVLKIVESADIRRKLEIAERDQLFLASIVSSAEDAIVSKDLNGIVTSWNRAAERLFGYTEQEIVGRPISLLIPADHPDEEPRILDRIRRGERIEHYETKRVRKDGRLIDVALTVSPIKDALGRIIGASKIARDITSQKLAVAREREALRETQEARKQAEEASRAKDEFLATISHELRTPMTAILGWTRMLLSGQMNPETQQKALETIDRNARSQAQLIEDLLDVSRIVSGKLRIEFKVVDIAAVVAAAVESTRPAAEAKRIRIQTVLSSGAGPLLGDFDRLQQVVWNLLSNAIRFTPADGLVRIYLQRVESQVELRVSDTGAGIPPEFLPHIFDRFTQADSSITRTHSGLGMGLAIVKSLVELHGGVLSASSVGRGHGSEFTVKLPVSSFRLDQSEEVRKPVLPTMNYGHELLGVKILVVDDESDTCEMLRFVFNQCGAIVETASSAEEALQLFDKFVPDMLVSDIGMPRVDGYDLIRLIRRERGSRIPAVALTAMARIDDRVKTLKAGYQMHIAKPVEPVELVSIVSGLVGLVTRPSTT